MDIPFLFPFAFHFTAPLILPTSQVQTWKQLGTSPPSLLWSLESLAAGGYHRTIKIREERSYPTSEVRGRRREDPICPRGGSQEELPHILGQGRQLGGSTLRQRPGAVAERSNPKSKKWRLCGRRKA